MEIRAIALARVMAYLEFFPTFDPLGKLLPEESVNKLRENYTFSVFPEKIEDLNIMEKPIVLRHGRFGDIVIDRLELHRDGILIDTRSSTANCELILADLVTFAKSGFGVNAEAYRRVFHSQIIFHSALRLDRLHPILSVVAEKVSAGCKDSLKQTFQYEPTAVLMAPDDSQAKLAPPVFSIERRSNIPFDERVYFSNAPLSTEAHISLLHDIEQALLD